MKKAILTIGLILYGLTCIGQIQYPTSDSTHIFWQPGVKITLQDYKGKPIQQIEELMEKYDFSASASVGIWSVLDCPKRVRDRYTKFEKVYFAPAFEKTTSYSKTEDKQQIEMQNLYFDICELWARWARKELRTLQDSTNATGVLTIHYLTVKQDMNEGRLKMFRDYFNDVFIEKNIEAFDKWRKEINEALENTKKWATTPEECYRLMTKKPIEKGYIMAPTLVGAMNKKE